MSEITFKDLWLSQDTLEALEEKWYKKPSPIQERVIPLLLNWEKDIIWQAQTGTGKTASFGIPLVERINPKAKAIKAIVLCPTRELAIQVSEEIKTFSLKKSISSTTLYGWQSIRDEIRELKSNPSIVVWTPGRVKDHINKKRLNLDNIDYFVLDEADEMLNIGFREEIEEIMKETPKEKKILLFSATMPDAIMNIAKKYMGKYDLVSVKKQDLTNSNIEQKYYEISRHNKLDWLSRIIEMQEDFYSIVFCKTKMDVDELASNLMAKWYMAEWIHWDIEQKMREKILKRFKERKINILVATDVAARWIDINNISHVINYSLPENPEIYTHRIWRTARAWNKWVAITFVWPKERRKIFYFENTIKSKIKKEILPKASDVIEMKKVHLIENIKKQIDENDAKNYMDLAKELLQIEDNAEVLISALIKKFYDRELNIENYSSISEYQANKETRWWNSNQEMRLFIAKWRKDWINSPGKVLDLLGRETGVDMKNAWRIELFDKFSYINMPEQEADIILQVFKWIDKRKPLVVKAKSKEHFRKRR